MSSPTYLIHVNFVDHKVGLRSTSGCVSLFADDMKELYSLISLDTPVYIINQPVKVALDQGSLYVESHKPMSEDITDFENSLEIFKDSFGKNYSLASRRFETAIIEIDKSIRSFNFPLSPPKNSYYKINAKIGTALIFDPLIDINIKKI